MKDKLFYTEEEKIIRLLQGKCIHKSLYRFTLPNVDFAGVWGCNHCYLRRKVTNEDMNNWVPPDMNNGQTVSIR